MREQQSAESGALTPEERECPPCGVVHDLLAAWSLGMVCERCGQHTGNYTQGHYWGLCKVLTARGVPFADAVREAHFCCPGDCALEAPTPPGKPGATDA